MDNSAKKKPFYKKKKYWVIAIILVVVFFGIRALTSQATKPAETATVSKGNVSEDLVLSGELKAVQHANLPFNVSGTLSWVGVKVGDSVKRGQALAKLDTTTLNAAYQQALSNLRITQSTVDRVHDDLKGKDSTETFEEKETRVAAEAANDKAYDAFVSAQKSLRDATLVAPFDGLVSSIANESAGINITATVAQVTVVNPSTLYFSVNADQTDISKIKMGDPSEVSLDAFIDAPLKAKVSQISFTPSTQDSGTVYPLRLTLDVDNSDYLYKVGMTGDARFVLSQKENVLWVPTKFVKTDKTGKYVVTDEKGTKTYIEVGIEGDDKVEIKGTISEGQIVYN